MRIRKRIFIGCEGASERSYVRWLQERADDLGKSLTFDAHIVGGGDPLAVVKGSLKKLASQTRRFGRYKRAAVLLDSDRLGQAPARDALIPNTAKDIAVLLYQEFDHEALLLRHFPRCERLRPPPGQSLNRLVRVWPDYRKPADALALSRRLVVDDLRRLLTVEPTFEAFFTPLLFD